jgi:hypothetical protein
VRVFGAAARLEQLASTAKGLGWSHERSSDS